MAKKYTICGMGNALVDIVTEVDDAHLAKYEIEKGLMTLVEADRQAQLLQAIDLKSSDLQCGGSAANTVIGAAQLGASCYYTCKVADDEMGRFYLKDLKSNGVDSNLHSDALQEGITGKCLVMTTPDSERTMNTFLGITADFSAAEISEAAILDSEYLYIEGYLVASESGRQAMKQAKRFAEENGIRVSLTFSDPSMVKYFNAEMLEIVGSGVDLLFCNEEEAMLFTDTDNLPDALSALKQRAAQFACTQGPEGATIYDGESLIDVAPYPTKAVDSNGAGDLFAGAFLYGLTHGLSHAEAGQLACRAASKVVSKYGPRLTAEQMAVIKAS